MEETAKERIKRKRKNRAEEIAKTSVVVEEIAVKEPLQTKQKREGVTVLEIYPVSKPKPKFLFQGSVRLKIHKVGLQVRNVPYSIDKKHKVRVQPPFRYYNFPDDPEKPDEYVESIKFNDGKIWIEAVEAVKTAVLELHHDELPQIEELVKS